MAEKKFTKQEHDIKREKFMTQDEMKDINDKITMLLQNKGYLSGKYSEWEDIEVAYRGDQPKVSGRPNTRINIMNANIEGQVAELIDQNVAVATRGEGPSDNSFAEWGRIGIDWTMRKNRIKKILDVHERRRTKFGEAYIKPYFDADAMGGFGLVKWCLPPLNKIFIDNKIKDPLRFQEAEYIAEAIRLSKTQFIDMYGEEKASIVNYGTVYIEETNVFAEDETTDDDNAATLIQWWERHKGTLRLMEFTGDGMLMYDSHKEGDRTTNQKSKKADHKPYYKYVNDKYPYFFTGMYPIEGNLHGFGDGKLLLPLQNLINDLYDKIRIAARPNLILFDINTMVDLEDFDENSLEPRPCEGNPEGAVKSIPWGTVNSSWWQLLKSIHDEVQRVTRFSALMMGQKATSGTATEATIQQQQGNSGVNHKKQLLEETLVEVCEYTLGLMMEHYTEAKAFRISEDEDKFEWIDFRKMANVPAMKPATDKFSKEYEDRTGEKAEWELLEEDGNPLTKSVDLDIEISIGAGIPKNKAFVWQMIQQLSAIALPDAMGNPRPVVSFNELRKFINDYLGIPLDEEEVQNIFSQPMPGMMPGQQPGQMPMQSPNAPLSANGNPMMSALPQNPGGGML